MARYYVCKTGRRLAWPYSAYEGERDWPYGKLLNVAMTLRGAKRIIRHAKRKALKPAQAEPRMIYVEES